MKAVGASEDPAGMVMRELAGVLPGLLDEQAIRELAERLRPHLASTSTETADEHLLTTQDAADYAQVNVETIRRAVRAGEIPVAARIGRSSRLTSAALDAWLAETSPAHVELATHSRRRRRREGSTDGSLRALWREPS